MIESITLSNFKSSQGLELPLAALTVLSGLNGSGKSSLLQSLALLRQGSRVDEKRLRCPLNGELVSLGRVDDVLFENALTGVIEIEVNTDEGPIEFAAEPNTDDDTIDFEIAGEEAVVTSFLGCPLQYVQADRLTPRPRYAQASARNRGSGWLGVGGEFTVDFLSISGDSRISERRRAMSPRDGDARVMFDSLSRTDSLLDQTAGWLQHISPGVRAHAFDVSDADATSLRFNYSGTGISSEGRKHRPSNVGFGLTYVLPIIVACLSARSGSLLLLENPEAHLHPRGQSAMGMLLSLAASDGVQILVETHSDHLLNGIRVAAKLRRIEAALVALHFFRRDMETGASSVVSPRLSASGRLDQWPDGFFDEWSKALDDLIG